MRVSVFGLGYVGCVTAACLARDGHEVVGVDLSAEKVATVAAGKSPLVETGLDDLMRDGVRSGRLRATTSAAEAIAATDIALLCVGTPTGPGGRPDLSALGRVGRTIGAALRGREQPFTVVMRSTVPPGTTEGMLLRAITLGACGQPIKVRVAVSPEFTREGAAVHDFDCPPYTLIGSASREAIGDVRELYGSVIAPVLETDLRVAEMVKCVSNSFHALKICFANEIAALCAARQVDANEVLRIFRLDTKLNLGDAYLRPGFAFGGSCLPKDVRGLAHLGRAAGVGLPLLTAIIPSNQLQIARGLAAILATGKQRIGFVGLAFKPGTDDVRESPYLALVEELLRRGHEVKVFDRSMSAATLVGANRSYLADHVPDVAGLFVDSVAALAEWSDALVLAHLGTEAKLAVELARPGCAVIDLERSARAGKPRTGERVVSRPWRRTGVAAVAAATAVTIALLALVSGTLATGCGERAARAAQAEHVLAPDDDLQAALDAAHPGDTLVLAAGSTYIGPFVLPRKSGDAWITIRGATLPPADQRVDASMFRSMPKLVGAGGPVLAAAPGAHNYRLVGLEIHPASQEFVTNLVELGTPEASAANLPHDLEIRGCYLHGDPDVGGRRGIALNSGRALIADSVISDFKEKGNDSQAIAGWSGPGPFTIRDNYLEGAGENLLFGGGDPPDATRIPSDIEIRGNHFAKPLTWKGAGWTVKNLFELKDARRVTVEGNLFEHNWADGQNGFAILFTVRNQDGTAPFSTVEDVTFRGNVVRGAGAGMNILGRDDSHGGQSGQAHDITIRDNLFYDIGGPTWGGAGTLFQVLDGTTGITIEHNTAFQTGNVITADGVPHQGFVFRDNVVACNQYGIIGTGAASGLSTLSTYFPGAEVRGNLLAGGQAESYPAGNYFAASLGQVVNLDAEHGTVAWIGPPSFKSSDGPPLGADRDALTLAMRARRE